MLFAMGQCDILKISDDEALFVSGCGTVEAGAAWIRERFGNIRLMLTTLGKAGRLRPCRKKGRWRRTGTLQRNACRFLGKRYNKKVGNRISTRREYQ